MFGKLSADEFNIFGPDADRVEAEIRRQLCTPPGLDATHNATSVTVAEVLNDSDGHADKRTRAVLTQQFANHGLVVVEVPFDAHLRPGGVIDVTNEMSPKTRRRFYEIAAAIADHFSSTNAGRREQRSR